MNSSILEEYKKKHPGSLALYQEAQALNPDGVTHEARYLLPFPIYMDRGAGPRKWDVDGNEYVGYVMGHGSLILGHCHPGIVEEVNKQIQKGTHLGFNTEHEIRWTKAIKALMPSIEKVRFHSSGTESTLMAFRLSRAFTGKNKILKFTNHFHGWQDYAAVSGGTHTTAGVPQKTVETVEVIDQGNIDAVEKMIKNDGDIAAVIIEPTGAKGGALPVKPEFLKELREVTERLGVVLIFDEVITGFRCNSGGAQQKYGIRPDLTTMAKIVAGGFPGGAVGGRAEILDMITHREDEQWNRTRRI
jgi:glutamate-1-semialdehyde 2,1-aminomutase